MASGVVQSSIDEWFRGYKRFKDFVLSECRVAVAETREQFFNTLADILGSVGPEGGKPPIGSGYAPAWRALTKRWVSEKTRRGLDLNIGTALGETDPGLKAYLISIGQQQVETIRQKDSIVAIDVFTQPEDVSGYVNGSARDPLAKMFFVEFGVTFKSVKKDGSESSTSIPARPFFYPALRWYQFMAKGGDDLVIKPYIQALHRAKAIIYGS